MIVFEKPVTVSFSKSLAGWRLGRFVQNFISLFVQGDKVFLEGGESMKFLIDRQHGICYNKTVRIHDTKVPCVPCFWGTKGTFLF